MGSFAILTILPILFWSAIRATSIEKTPNVTSRSILSKRAEFMTQNQMMICDPNNENRKYSLHDINAAAQAAKGLMERELRSNPELKHRTLESRLKDRNTYPMVWNGDVPGFEKPFMKHCLTIFIVRTVTPCDFVILDRNYQVADVRNGLNNFECQKEQITQPQTYAAPSMSNTDQIQNSRSSSVGNVQAKPRLSRLKIPKLYSSDPSDSLGLPGSSDSSSSY